MIAPGLLAPRALRAWRPPPARAAAPDRLAFRLVLAAILLQLTISANLLRLSGIHYSALGGLPLEKFHIATYLAVAALVVQATVGSENFPRRIADQPHFPLAFALMSLCAAYALASTGMSGSAVYIESYAAAAVLAFCLSAMAEDARRRIGRAMLALFAINAALCVGETMLGARLVPIFLNDEARDLILIEPDTEFRGTALYDHPLTGAMMTMMGVLLCLASDLRPRLKMPLLALLMTGLVAFGGRAAIAVTLLCLAMLAAWHVLDRILRKKLDCARTVAVAAACVVVPAFLAALLLATPIGSRISAKLYADDSARVRIVQWLVLDHMDLREVLFGMDIDRRRMVVNQIGLQFPFCDVENFWLLVFVNLGAVGFVVWLAGFAALLRGLWRQGSVLGRLLVAAVMITASTSNSLGRKSNILFVCVAASMAASAFAPRRPAERLS